MSLEVEGDPPVRVSPVLSAVGSVAPADSGRSILGGEESERRRVGERRACPSVEGQDTNLHHGVFLESEARPAFEAQPPLEEGEATHRAGRETLELDDPRLALLGRELVPAERSPLFGWRPLSGVLVGGRLARCRSPLEASVLTAPSLTALAAPALGLLELLAL